MVMEMATVQCRPTPLHFSPGNLFLLRRTNLCSLSYRNYRPKISRQKRSKISASSSSSNGSQGFSWQRLSQSIRLGSQRFFENLGDSVKKETGFNLDDVMIRVDEFSARARDSAWKAQDTLERVNSELLPQFVSWNKWESWKV